MKTLIAGVALALISYHHVRQTNARIAKGIAACEDTGPSLAGQRDSTTTSIFRKKLIRNLLRN